MPTEHDYIDVRDLFVSINPHGLDQSELTRDGASFLEPQTINDYHLFRAGYQAALEAQQGQGEPLASKKIHIEVRECESCNHIGVDDSHSTMSTCHECEWSGPEPVEDKCPGCERENCMAAACLDCGSRYVLATSKTIEVAADPAEVERLRRDLHAAKVALEARARTFDILRAQLAEAHALLRKIGGYNWANVDPEERARTRAELRDMLSASAEPSALNDCAICCDLGNQCMECEEGEFREWADRHFAAADYRKTDAGMFIQDWMRHAYGAWCARGALGRKP